MPFRGSRCHASASCVDARRPGRFRFSNSFNSNRGNHHFVSPDRPHGLCLAVRACLRLVLRPPRVFVAPLPLYSKTKNTTDPYSKNVAMNVKKNTYRALLLATSLASAKPLLAQEAT